MSEEAVNNAVADCVEAYDTCLFMDTIMSRGGFGQFIIPECGTDKKFFGWPGLGGSFAVFNPEYNFSFSYVMNGAGLSLLTGGRARELLIVAFNSHMKVYHKEAESQS